MLRQIAAREQHIPKAWQFPLPPVAFFQTASAIEREGTAFQEMFSDERSLKILEIVKGGILELRRRATEEAEETIKTEGEHCLVRVAALAAGELNGILAAPSNGKSLKNVARQYPAWPVVIALNSKVPGALPVKSAAAYLEGIGIGQGCLLSAITADRSSVGTARNCAMFAFELIHSLPVGRPVAVSKSEVRESFRFADRVARIIGIIPVGLDDAQFNTWLGPKMRRLKRAHPKPELNPFLRGLCCELLVSDLSRVRDVIWNNCEQAINRHRELSWRVMMNAISRFRGAAAPARTQALREALGAVVRHLWPEAEADPQLFDLVAYQVRGRKKTKGLHGGTVYEKNGYLPMYGSKLRQKIYDRIGQAFRTLLK